MTDAELFTKVRKRLDAEPFRARYKNETAFEGDVWRALRKWVKKEFKNNCRQCDGTAKCVLLTSHKSRDRDGRCARCFENFKGPNGPDVKALGSNNRLDIVIRDPEGGTVGIEVKCLGDGKHANKLVHGLGQAALALAHRPYAILIIHCGTETKKMREDLRKIGTQFCDGSRLAVIVAPKDVG